MKFTEAQKAAKRDVDLILKISLLIGRILRIELHVEKMAVKAKKGTTN